MPPELKPKSSLDRPRGEASLRGHLRGEVGKDKKEESGSSAYVPKEPEKDQQLQYALKILRGEPVETPPQPQPEVKSGDSTQAEPSKKE